MAKYGVLKVNCGIAADIGTTNVELALVELASGEIVARHGFVNPQRIFGADVISRITAANSGSAGELRRLIEDGLAEGIAALCDGVCVRDAAKKTVIAGNTAMIHFLLGLSCEGLGRFPFAVDKMLQEHKNNSEQQENFFRKFIPHLTPFVGGDITAGVLHVLPLATAARKNRFLLIDLGTNGEMVLYDGGKITVASAAAGPAFERVRGGASGTIAELARLLRMGEIDETGLLQNRVDECHSSTQKNFSQKKIRDLQLAKSAVCSGLEILLENADKPDVVFLAGGMGAAIDADDAADIGLIPLHLREKTIAVGNSALGGAVRLLTSPEEAERDLREILRDCEEIILAQHPRFEELFLRYINLGPF